MDLTRVAHQQTEVNSIARQDEVKKRTKQSNGYERPKKEIPTLNRFDTLSDGYSARKAQHKILNERSWISLILSWY